MHADASQSDPSDTGALPPEPPRPRPLLVPAVAFIGGIWLSEALGAGGMWLRWLAFALPCVVLLTLFSRAVRLAAGGRVAAGGRRIVRKRSLGVARRR